jgi:hypothetical protein
VHDSLRDKIYGAGEARDSRLQAVNDTLTSTPSSAASSLLTRLTPPRLAAGVGSWAAGASPGESPQRHGDGGIPFSLSEAVAEERLREQGKAV